MKDRRIILSKNLCKLRKETGLNQKEFAEKVGVSQSNLSKWERCITLPDYDNLCTIADKLDVTTDYLLRNKVEYNNCQKKAKDLEAFMKLDYHIEIGAFLDKIGKLYYAKVIEIPEIITYEITKEKALLSLEGAKRKWGYEAIENDRQIPKPKEM